MRPGAPERLDRLPLSRWHWGIIILCATAWLVEAIDIGLVGSTLPSLKSEFRLATWQQGLIASSTALGIVIGMIPSGIAIDRFGKRSMLLAGMVIYGVLTLPLMIVRDWASFTTIRIASGIGMGMMFSIPYQILVEFVRPQQRGFSVGAASAVLSLGYFVNVGVASLVVPVYGWRPMYALGVVPLLAIIPIALWLPESPRWLEVKGRYEAAERNLRRIEDAVARSTGLPLPPARETVLVLESRERVPYTELFAAHLIGRTILVWLLVCTIWSIFYLYAVYLPIMLRMQGYALGTALLVAALGNAAAVAAHLLGGWLVEVIGRKLTISLFAVVALAGGGLLAVSGHALVWAVLGAVIVVSLGTAGSSFVKLYAAELYPTRVRGTGTTWMEAVGRGVAGVLIPFSAAGILRSHGILAETELIAGLGLLGVLSLAIFGRETVNQGLESLDPARLTVAPPVPAQES